MKNKNLLESFNHAIDGIIYTIKSERNIKIHIAAAALVLILSVIFELSRVEFLIVCIAIGFVMVCELFNTAIEVITDIIVDVYHPKAKIVKDVAAGAVLLSTFVSVIIGYFIFFDKFALMLEKGIKIAKQSPINITVTALILTIITVLTLKAIYGKGTPLHGGMPSGHAAVAFSILTAVTLWTEDTHISILCFILALMVIQSRLEGKIHNKYELFAGSLVGFLITLLLFQIFG